MLRSHAAQVRPTLPWPQQRLLERLPKCRTPALGGRLLQCDHCGHEEVHYHPCQDRHCPTCAGARTARWVDERQDKLLPVPHFQVVFTLPEQLHGIARAAPGLVYGQLMSAAASTLQDVLRTQYKARFAITAVLHTWTREMHLHPHVHFIVSAGGLALDDSAWVATSDSFLVSTRKLEPLFRGRMLSGLRAARNGGKLNLVDPLASRWESLLDTAYRKTWVIHVEPPKKRSPGTLLKYLARYLFRVAIDDFRVLSHDGSTVTIRTRGDATVTMSGESFARRFAQHALPKGFRKVRHYGLLAPANINTRLPLAFEQLGAIPASVHPKAPDPRRDPTEPPMVRCPRCGSTAVIITVLCPTRGPPRSNGGRSQS